MSTEAAVKPVVNSSENNEFSCGCNLDLEFTDADEELIKKLNLTDDELMLKEKNLDEFWKLVAEKLRSKLSDTLEDNKELHKLKDLMEEDNQELEKENAKLTKLVTEAQEICNEFMRTAGNDSGIID